MSIFQIMAVLFALFMLYTVQIHKKKKTISASESSLWYSVWILFILLAVFPNLLLGISQTLNFQRVFDLLVVGAFVIISVISFQNYFRQKKTEQRIEQLVRENAILEEKNKKK